MADGITPNSDSPSFSSSRHIQCAAARWVTTFTPGNIADASLGDLVQGGKELFYFLEGYVTNLWQLQPLLASLKTELPIAHITLTQPLDPYCQALGELEAFLRQLCPNVWDKADDRGMSQLFPCAAAHGASTFWSGKGADAPIGERIEGLTKLLRFVECHITETWGFRPLLDSLKAELPVTNRVLTPPLEPYYQTIVEIKTLLKPLRASH
jgi:hypothetical protein